MCLFLGKYLHILYRIFRGSSKQGTIIRIQGEWRWVIGQKYQKSLHVFFSEHTYAISLFMDFFDTIFNLIILTKL